MEDGTFVFFPFLGDIIRTIWTLFWTEKTLFWIKTDFKIFVGLKDLIYNTDSDKVHIVVKMRRFPSFLSKWFQSHGYPVFLAPFLDKRLILGIFVWFRDVVYNRD